jgi:hypothetical protein
MSSSPAEIVGLKKKSLLSRRKFIFVGVAGVIAAAAAAIVIPKLRGGPAPKGVALVKQHENMLRVVATALLGSALSADAPLRAAELARVNTAIGGLIDSFPPSTRKEIGDLFGLLDLKLARAALGYSGDWLDAEAPAVAQFLYGLRDSSIALKQQAYFALHDMVLGSFYAEPKTWAAMGYPGPPKLG